VVYSYYALKQYCFEACNSLHALHLWVIDLQNDADVKYGVRNKGSERDSIECFIHSELNEFKRFDEP